MHKRSGFVPRTVAGMMALTLMGATVGEAFQAEDPGAAPIAATDVMQNGGQSADAVTGQGPWIKKMMCATCAGVLLATGGTSVAGILLIAAAVPQYIPVCVGLCIQGFS